MGMATAADLPTPTRDLDRVRADIDRWGYGLLEEALEAPLLGRARTRLLEQAAAELQHGHAFEDGGPTQQWGHFRDEAGKIRPEAFTAANGGVNQRVWLLPNKGQVFRDVLELGPLHEAVGHVLGEEYQLSSYSANIAKSGGLAMSLHTDQWWAPEPTRRGYRALPVGSMTRTRFNLDTALDDPPAMVAPAACSNVIFMMNDFTDANGGTRLVPGSHHAGRHPDPQRDRDVETIAAEGPAGTAIITDGRIWHGTGSNRTNAPRIGMLLTFCGPQYRPQVNFTVAMDRAILATASDRLKTLFGLKVWWGYGRTGHPSVEFIDPSETGLGELRPD
ncbi:MAG: phytanoyl-CoA dioxygenase family protein [Alphaproteobacteria bacterium]|nr:phytanoyl-CoA dioxygenase family protein [Alphaproteobacteria bacterium]